MHVNILSKGSKPGAVFQRPRLLTEAVTLAIYGYHFRKIAEQTLR